jgi:hypothetical protein
MDRLAAPFVAASSRRAAGRGGEVGSELTQRVGAGLACRLHLTRWPPRSPAPRTSYGGYDGESSLRRVVVNVGAKGVPQQQVLRSGAWPGSEVVCRTVRREGFVIAGSTMR